MSQPKGYVDTEYLRVVGEFVKHLKQRSYTLMHIQPGHKVLDVGCGPGTDTIPIATLVGPSGQVVGVDYDPAMIAEARNRAEQAGVSSWVTHQQADVTSLPFSSEAFDSCRCERVFQHLPHPEHALGEMVRVTRAGGWVVVLDTDWGTMSLDSPNVDLERRLARIKAEYNVNNGYAGRQLYRLFQRQDLTEITVEMYPLFSTDYAFAREGTRLDEVEREALNRGAISSEELHRWHTDLEQAATEGIFFGSVSQVMVAGRR